jgi:acyl-CoA thioester hydrolase
MKNIKPKEFSWPVRVYYEDTDSGGVVYYANYLKFMERARTELLRSIGFEQDKIQQELGVLFAVSSVNIQYKKPARFNDELNVITSITALGKASIHFKQSVMSMDGRPCLHSGAKNQEGGAAMSMDGRYVAKSQEGGATFLASTQRTDVTPAQLLSSATIKIACLNAAKFAPQSTPSSIINKIKKECFCGS